MLVYYGKRGVKRCPPTTPSPGVNPIGILGLVCSAVRRPKFPPLITGVLTHLPQVERALLMHSTGRLIQDKRAFSEVNWGSRTRVYIKLAGQMNDSQWTKFYSALDFAGEMEEKLKEFSRPVEHWTDNPDEYFIVGSDPAEEEVGSDLVEEEGSDPVEEEEEEGLDPVEEEEEEEEGSDPVEEEGEEGSDLVEEE